MDKVFNKVFIVFGVLFAGLQLFDAGLDAHKGFYNDSVFSVVSAAFWVFLIWIFVHMEVERRIDSKLEKSHKEHMKRMAETFDQIAKITETAQEERHQHDMIEAIIKDVVGKGKPAAKHCAKIAKAIHDNLEIYADVSFNKQGGFDVGLSKQPIEKTAPAKKAAPGRSAAHAAAAKRGDAARAKANTKPVTKKKGNK